MDRLSEFSEFETNSRGDGEELLRRLFADAVPGESTYGFLASRVSQWLDHVQRQFSAAQSDADASRRHLSRLSNAIDRRRFGEFRAFLRGGPKLEYALIELFLQSRIRTYVLAYLSVQEGEEFEGRDQYDTRAPQFILQLLARLGRRSNCRLSFGISRFRVHVDIDPLMPLRKLYGLLLLGPADVGRRSWSFRLLTHWHRFQFRWRTRIVGIVLRSILRKANAADSRQGIERLLRFPVVRRLLATFIYILFEGAKDLSEAEWNALLDRIEAYFASRLAELVRAMPAHSFRDQGLIKLCKVAFGTIVGRTAAREMHRTGEAEFIFDSFRLAYSWGSTYPLVDNVLDSAATSRETREQLTKVLKRLFDHDGEYGDGRETAGGDVTIREVERRMVEMLSLVPPSQLNAAKVLLRFLLESHERDSSRRLSALDPQTLSATEKEVYVDTALKSALIRLATMEVCGIPVDGPTAARALERSLFNQLGDDLWDIYEDVDQNRVTPFTLNLLGGGTTDPFEFYLKYTDMVSRGQSRRRQTAAYMGFCETLRDSLIALKQRSADPLHVADRISRLIRESVQLPPDSRVSEVPHVDFDAVLFAFEAALFELVPRSSRE